MFITYWFIFCYNRGVEENTTSKPEVKERFRERKNAIGERREEADVGDQKFGQVCRCLKIFVGGNNKINDTRPYSIFN